MRICDWCSYVCSSDLARQVRLVIADDADPVAAVVLVQVGDDRAEADAAVHRLAFRAHHRGILQSARQPVAAPVDLAQALLVVDVVAVLAAVAVTGGPGDNGADLVALLLQPPQLLLKARETLGRDQAAEIVGHGTAGDRKSTRLNSS